MKLFPSKSTLLTIAAVASIWILTALAAYAILQTEPNQVPANQTDILPSPCESTPKSPECWQETIEKTLQLQGLGSALALVNKLYSSEPDFASDCHDYLHVLGERAYESFKNGKNVEITPETSYCAYGFYHGFMQSLLVQSGDLSSAHDFCSRVAKTVPQVLADACQHGVGHGAAEYGVSNPEIWGKTQAIIDTSLATCKNIGFADEQFSRCASGVFMEVAIYFTEDKYLLKADESNPFRICEEQEQLAKIACFTQMNVVVSRISGGDFGIGVKYVENIVDDFYAAETVRTLGGTINATIKDHDMEIKVCQAAQSRLRLPCIQGLALAFMLRGRPGSEYLDAIDFCQKKILSEDERKTCFELIFGHSAGLYPASKIPEVCRAVPKMYKNEKYCQKI